MGNFIGVHQYLEYILCMIFLKFILLMLGHYLYIHLMLASFELIIRHICNISGAYFIMRGYFFTLIISFEKIYLFGFQTFTRSGLTYPGKMMHHGSSSDSWEI